VSEYNSQLWNSTDNDQSPARKQARDQKRRLHYVSNIYVVSDPKNPENEGKVFLFKYGKKIFDKITMAMNPEFEGDSPVNPFDLWNGANFKLRIRTVDNYPNYDQSVFDAPKALSDDDAELERIWQKEYSLKEFIAPSNFKTYDELKKRLDEVLGLVDGSAPAYQAKESFKPVAPTPAARKAVEEELPAYDTDDDDEELKAFKNMALG
jgi:hypothetical protein